MEWNWQTVGWAALALALIAAETMVPGAFLLWLGFAAAAVFVLVLAMPGLSLLSQVAAFVVLSFVFVQVYRRYFRGRERASKPETNAADELFGIAGVDEVVGFLARQI